MTSVARAYCSSGYEKLGQASTPAPFRYSRYVCAAETYVVARRNDPAGGVTSVRRYVTRSGCAEAPAGRSHCACQSAARNAVVNAIGAETGPHVCARSRGCTVHS